jgi:SAM-dependent methyltransferase
MSSHGAPPETASLAHAAAGARLVSPSAARNAAAITDALAAVAPKAGLALELASGTGQHVAAFARAMPGLTWRPTEVDPEREASIGVYVADAALANLLPPLRLDATAPGWGADHGGQALIVLVNLLHLIGARETQALIAEAASALAPGGRFAIYGPFLRDGETTSPGDAQFHASLRTQDPATGYKDVAAVCRQLEEAGLTPPRILAMPANNLMLVAGR